MIDAIAPSDDFRSLRAHLRHGRRAIVGFRVRRAIARSLPIAFPLLVLATAARPLGLGSTETVAGLVTFAAMVVIASALLAAWPTRRSEREWTRWWDDAAKRPQTVQIAHELLSRSTGWTPWERSTIARADLEPPSARALAAARPDRWTPLAWRVALPLTVLVGATALLYPVAPERDSPPGITSDSETPSSRAELAEDEEAVNRNATASGESVARSESRSPSAEDGRSSIERLRRELATRSSAAARLAPVTELAPLGEWLLGATAAPPDLPTRRLSEAELARLREAVALLEQGGESDLARWLERWAEGDASPPPDVGFADGDDWRAALAELERVSAAAPSQFRDRNRASGGDDPARNSAAEDSDRSDPTSPDAQLPTASLRLSPDRIAEGARSVDPPRFDDPKARAAWVDLWSSPEVEPRFLILAHLHARSTASTPAR